MIPSLFKKDADESMMLQVWEIRQIIKSSQYPKQKINIDPIIIKIKKMAAALRHANKKEIAVCIETIASTFSIQVPNELGLQQYFSILGSYPAAFLKDCMNDIIRTFKYPRLPLPVEFVDRMETNYEYHKGWLQRITKDIYTLEVMEQNEYNKRTKEK